MKFVYIAFALVVVASLGSCRSRYAAPNRPVILQAPIVNPKTKLIKVLTYSLATRGWKVEKHELDRLQASYKNIRIEVTVESNGKLSVRHLNRRLGKSHANSLKRWLGALQQTMRGVAVYDQKRLDDGLRAYGIDPEAIERLDVTTIVPATPPVQ